MKQIRQTLIDIQASQSFERLEPFKKTAVWNTLEPDERRLLARLLVMHGTQQLAEGSHQVLESFENAAQISAYDPEILYQQGLALASYPDNIRCLNLASQAFKQALKQQPEFLNARYALALVLTEIGLCECEPSFFIEADNDFQYAISLYDSGESPVSKGTLYWKWGRCLASLGRLSGEPLDFHRAIEKYTSAAECGCAEVDFCNDYGNAYAELASLLDNRDYFAKALTLFNQGLLQEAQSYEGWYNQGCCLVRLFSYVRHYPLLEQAERSFNRAAEINPENYQVWLKWGQLETLMGKARRDKDKLISSLERYAKANELEPNHPRIFSSWAESELSLGAQDDRLDMLQSAQNKIVRSIEIQPDDPAAWYIFGSCYHELGAYFEEEDYFHQAVAKFTYGLEVSNQQGLLWYGLALSYYALGAMLEEKDFLEKSVRSFSRVLDCGEGGFSQFWNDWGVALLKLADFTDEPSFAQLAIEKFEQSLKNPETDAEVDDIDLEWVYNYGCAYDLLGELEEETHHFEKAIQILSQVLQLDPNYVQARYNLALAYSHLGELTYEVEPYHQAIEHFESLLEQDSEDEMIHLDFGIALTNLGILVEEDHHPERSEALFRLSENHLMQAAALGNTQAYYQLAGLYSITGNYELAIHYLERAQFAGTLPGIDDLMNDEWLEDLRHTSSFRQFINGLSSEQWMDEK